MSHFFAVPRSIRTFNITFVASLVAAVFAAGSALAEGISQSGEQKNVKRVGHVDLQGRASYHPYFIVYPDGRVIAFAGMHSSTTGSNAPRPNPLKPGSPVEANGTMIVDITDPKHPVEKFHIPGPVTSPATGAAQTQSNRPCLGSDLPGGMSGKVYLMRNVQGGGAAVSGYELWDVTDVSSPVKLKSLTGIRNTHKLWWECKTGIAYLPGSRDVAAPNRWRVGQQMVIYDWSRPHDSTYPLYIRTFGLPGAQPDADGTKLPPTLHGPISAFEHPNRTGLLARGTLPDGVIGNRLYLAYGVGDNGVLQILDRKKLLPPSLGGTWTGDPDRPSVADLLEPQTARLDMSNDQGGHTSMPVFGLAPKSYHQVSPSRGFTEFLTRDIVLLASEATADLCQEAPHWSFIVDVTIENSKNASAGPPPLNAQQNPWQGPMVLSTMSVDPRAGEKYPRGNYCTRGARFGVHSSEENFRNPYYGRLTFLAYFTGGVRVWDIREPQEPVEVGFYVPVANANTDPIQLDGTGGYMTNNLEVDNRGYIIAVDRNGSGLDILELRGKARKIGLGQDNHGDYDDDD